MLLEALVVHENTTLSIYFRACIPHCTYLYTTLSTVTHTHHITEGKRLWFITSVLGFFLFHPQSNGSFQTAPATVSLCFSTPWHGWGIKMALFIEMFI